MAVANIRDRIEDIHLRLRQNAENARDMASKRFTTKITIHAKEFAYVMTDAINKAAEAQGLIGSGPPPATERDVRLATWDTIAKWSKGNFGSSAGWKIKSKKELKCEVTSYGAEVIRYSPNEVHTPYLRVVNSQFRRDVLKNWKENFNEDIFADAIEYNDKFVEAGGTWGTGFSHDADTNVANAGLVNWIEGLGEEIIPVESYYTTTNIAQRVLDSLEIKWEQEVNPQTGKMEWIIRGELGGINPEKGDQDLTAEWENKVIEKLDEILFDEDLAFYDPDFVASKPFLDIVGEEAVRKVIKPYHKRGAKIKNFPKKNKKSKRSGKVKPKKRAKKTKSGSFKTAANVTSMRKERGSMRNTEAGAIQLAKLKRLINRRLPAEVRRNMGRPALINRTGRFSNSVQLLSLMEGKNTVIAKYAYLLNPYQTFENTGKKRWPLAYNPKTLIAKSIRNLAEGRIAQKLTIRRA